MLKLKTIQAPKHFIAYSFSFMGYGCIITGLGPLVPYLSRKNGYPQTQYAFLFLCRSIGFLVGGVIFKFLEEKLSFHKILFYSSIFIGIFQIIFCYISDLEYQGLLKFWISAFCCFIEVTINLCVLKTQQNKDIDFWMLICHSQFSIGGLVGPILIYLFEINSFAIMGLMVLTVGFSYYFLQTPQTHKQIVQRNSKQSILSEIQNVGHDGAYPAIGHIAKRKVISTQTVALLSFMFLLCVTLQCSYGSWISTYVVLEVIASKQQATKYSSIFWISITLSRFITIFIHSKPIKKLFAHGFIYAFSSLITIIFISFDFKPLICTLSAIAFGIGYSSMFPLLMASPAQYNMQVTAGQGGTFMIWAALGEGAITTLTGYLMKWFDNDMLFYSIFFTGIVFLLCIYVLKKLYQKQAFKGDQIVQNQMNEIMLDKK